MKKYLAFFTNLLAVTASLATFALPLTTQAQVSCPAGYTCTPIPTQPTSCPAGYTCSPVDTGGSGGGAGGGGGSVSTNGATVAVNGTPTLALSYDSMHSEASLTATFNVTVTAGNSNLSLYTGIAGANLIDPKGNSAPFNLQVNVGAGEKTNQYGDYTMLAPGQSVQMSVILTANPKQLFAGSYYGLLSNLYVFGADGSPSPILSVPSNRTNTVTIVGETSPYITGFSTGQPFTPGQSIVVYGQRLDTSGGIFVDGVSIGNNAKGDNSNLGFPLPSTLSNGYHTLQIKSITTGASNNVSFQVQSSGGGSCGYVFSTNLSIGSTGPDVTALQTWLIANGYNIPPLTRPISPVPKGYYGNTTAYAVAAYQAAVGIYDPYVRGYAAVGPNTRAKLNGSCGTPVTPPVTTVTCPVGDICFPAGTSAICPAGYVCTLTYVNCPTGEICYTATSVGTNPTQPPVNNNTVSFQVVFKKTFNLTNVPTFANLGIAADNNYIVYVNGHYVGTGRNESAGQGNNNFDNITNYNVAPYLNSNLNTISITAQNYYSAAPSWPDNAFGLLYKLTDQSGNVLAASDGNEFISTATINGGSSVILAKPHQWYITTPGASWIWDSADPLYSTYLSYIGGTGQNQAPASITITSPNGNVLTANQTFRLYWTASSNISTVRIANYLSNSSKYGYFAQGIPASQGYFDYTTGPSPLPGNYILEIDGMDSNNNQLTSATANFSVASGSTSSKAPVILGSSAPTTLTVGQTGTWSVNASDPNNGTLSYSVNWGDSCPSGYVCSNAATPSATSQTSTFTHSYSVAGTYTVNITVTNSSGLTAKTSSTITVTGTTPTTQVSVSATANDASSDKVGIWNVWGPGTGRVNGNNPYDWHWSMNISNASGRTVKYVTVIMNGIREGWSTSASTNNAFGVQLYPLVAVSPGVIMTTGADQTFSVGLNQLSVELYGQPEDPAGTTFRGATLTVGFTDGSTATSQIPASSATIPAVTTTSQSPTVALSLDNASPLSSAVQISSSAQTQNVPLLTIDLKSQNAPSTLQSLVATVNTTGQQVASIFSNLSMRIAGQTFGAQTITNGNGNNATVVFSNFGNITLPANSSVPITIFGTVQQDTTGSLSGSSATVQVAGSGITALDANYNNIPVSGSASGSQITFTSAGVMLSNTSESTGGMNQSPTGTTTTQVTFNFTLTAGNNPIYVSSGSSLASVTASGSGAYTFANVVTNPASMSGDGSGYFYIAPGSSRQFSVIGVVTGSISGVSSVRVSSVNYGTSPSNLQSSSITQGLTGLSAIVTASAQNTSMTAAIWDAIRAYYAH